VRKTASFLEFSLCLPRACLGKIIVLIYKRLKNAVFFADLSGSWDEGTVAQTLFYFEMPFIYTFNARCLPRQAPDKHRKS
jgi:hypothetical protein